MIYQISKFSIFNFQFSIQPKKQQGVTLLLAILLLSAIMAISFSVATILFIEVRTSGDLLRTESALYGADSVAEEALFKIKRKVPADQFTYSTKIGSVDLGGTTPPVESSVTTLIYQEKVPTTSNTFDNTTEHFSFFDASNPTGGGNYGKIKLTYIDNGSDEPLTVYLCEFDPTQVYSTLACSDKNSTEYWHSSTPPGYGFQLKSINSPKELLINPSMQQELILINSVASAPIYVQIEAFGPSPNYVAKGIPLVGETAVDITAKNSGVTRKIRVLIPQTSVGSGSSPADTVWVEDAIPTGGSCGNDAPDTCPWNWISSNPVPYSGSYALQSGLAAGEHQSYFSGASNKLAINTGDTMVAYVYLNPSNLPTEIMLQWNSDAQGWNHRAYWGANNIGWGTDGTQSRRYMGSLPATGSWVRLEVPASQVGLEGLTLNGMAFTLYGGQATWDHGGKSP